MKQYFKVGLGLILPIALVTQVILWLGNISTSVFSAIVGVDIKWWGVPLGLLATAIVIILLGMLFTHLRFIRRIKENTERFLINKIPIVNKIYNFGKEITDTFITDIKQDGDLSVVEVNFGEIKALGVLTDHKNDLVMLLSAPSPLTGFVFKTKNYKILDINFVDAVKINTSLGRINGEKWK